MVVSRWSALVALVVMLGACASESRPRRRHRHKPVVEEVAAEPPQPPPGRAEVGFTLIDPCALALVPVPAEQLDALVVAGRSRVAGTGVQLVQRLARHRDRGWSLVLPSPPRRAFTPSTAGEAIARATGTLEIYAPDQLARLPAESWTATRAPDRSWQVRAEAPGGAPLRVAIELDARGAPLAIASEIDLLTAPPATLCAAGTVALDDPRIADNLDGYTVTEQGMGGPFTITFTRGLIGAVTSQVVPIGRNELRRVIAVDLVVMPSHYTALLDADTAQVIRADCQCEH